jgi:hypothetical protein
LGQNGSKFLRLRKPERQEVSKIDGTDSWRKNSIKIGNVSAKNIQSRGAILILSTDFEKDENKTDRKLCESFWEI